MVKINNLAGGGLSDVMAGVGLFLSFRKDGIVVVEVGLTCSLP